MDHILVLSGPQGSGKTTIAKTVQHRLRDERIAVIQKTFAEPLYEMHDFCLRVLRNAGIERDIVKDGPLLQMLGTDWARKTIDPNIWVKVMKGSIATQSRALAPLSKDKLFIISDCRFQNEFDAFPEAFKVRLVCGKEVRKQRCSAWRENDQHPSEIDLDAYHNEGKFDAYVDTMGATIGVCVDRILRQLEERMETRFTTAWPVGAEL